MVKMETLNKNFEPIKLINTNVISRKGYFYGKITRADTQFRDGNQILRVEVRIAKGKYQGFPIVTTFSNDFKGKVRLSYLCNAVGIIDELKSPEQLLGKILKLRVVPYYRHHMGRKYLNHKITRFHPVNESQLKNLKG
jgi:hypothetical protein